MYCFQMAEPEAAPYGETQVSVAEVFERGPLASQRPVKYHNVHTTYDLNCLPRINPD
jgi:hypothetical protein